VRQRFKLKGTHSQKSCMVTLYRKYTRALTFGMRCGNASNSKMLHTAYQRPKHMVIIVCNTNIYIYIYIHIYIYIYIGIKIHVVKFFVVFVSKREIFYTENTDFCDIHTWPTRMHTLAPIHIHIHIHIHT
jgi:hypothetical protein